MVTTGVPMGAYFRGLSIYRNRSLMSRIRPCLVRACTKKGQENYTLFSAAIIFAYEAGTVVSPASDQLTMPPSRWETFL